MVTTMYNNYVKHYRFREIYVLYYANQKGDGVINCSTETSRY